MQEMLLPVAFRSRSANENNYQSYDRLPEAVKTLMKISGPKRLFALYGPLGSGKTTTLKRSAGKWVRQILSAALPLQ
jgi:flagellar biosynthesis GTPase FlhF